MKRAMITATLTYVLATPVWADDDVAHNDVINGQLNLGQVWSGLNVTATDVDGDVNATSAAIGNSFSADLGDHSTVANVQRVRAQVSSELNATLADIDGDINLSSAAVGNTASVHSHGNVPCPNNPEDCPELRAELALVNRQFVGYIDPSASLNLTANGVGNVTGTAAAISNSLSVDMGGTQNAVDTYQRSTAPVNAQVNATISNASSVDLTSAAVGNTVSIDGIGN